MFVDWTGWNRLLGGLMPPGETAAPPPSLAEAVESARQEWLSAQRYYNSVSDEDLVDHAVYLMQASEKKYMYLLKQARRQGIRHCPFSGG